MRAHLLAVGERMPAWVAAGFEDYRKRLAHALPLDLIEIRPGVRGKGRDPARAIADEGAALLIGGADGLAEVVLARAELRWSLGPLTLPHMLVRVLVAEQLYRAASLLAGHPYHRG